MTDREAFEAGIAHCPLDDLRRNVFADWLEERGEVEEANRQRGWIAAYEWMRLFAARFELTYDEALEAGSYSADTGDVTVVQYGPRGVGMELSNAMCEGEQPLLDYWERFEILTGRRVTADQRRGEVFACES